jgi:phage baseplate assembly protein W
MTPPARHALDTLGRGLAFPFRAGPHGGIALVSGEDDVEEAIRLILSTTPGERRVRPEFGCDVHEYVFEQLTASTLGHIDRAIRQALDRWEPRIVVERIDFTTDDEAATLFCEITYRLRSSNSMRNLIYPFYVIPSERTV